MRFVASSLFALILLAGSARADGLTWITDDYDKGLETAKKAGKLMQVDWTAEWCGWCKKLDQDTWSNPDVAKYLSETFVNVKMDKDKFEDLAAKQGVEGIPALLFIDGSGRIVGRIGGYMPPEAYLPEVRKISANFLKLTEAEARLARDDKDLESHLAVAKVWVEAAAWEESDRHFQAVLDGDAANEKGFASDAWLGIAKSAEARHDHSRLDAALAKVEELDPKNEKGNTDNAAVMAGKRKLEHDDAEGAREDFANVMKTYPGTDGAGEALFWIAALKADMDGDFAGSMEDFRKLAKDYPTHPLAARVPDILKQLEEMIKEQGTK